ncbi:hypothetical protein [Rickettsia endosymbiont of Orchestes rusci]
MQQRLQLLAMTIPVAMQQDRLDHGVTVLGAFNYPCGHSHS